MTVVSASTVAAITKAVTPIISDLYQSAKGVSKKALGKWTELQFPKRLAKKIGGLSLVRTLWRPNDDVSLLKFYYPPKVRSIDSLIERSANFISDIGNENIIIQGIVGQGKSIFLRWLAIQEVKKEKNTRLPIFIEFRTLQPGYTLNDAIFKVLESYDIKINEEAFEHIAESGKIILLLDAFDELDERLVRSVLNEISFLARRFDKMQIVVTSRPGNEIQKVSGFKTMNISPLKPDDYQPFLTKMGLNIIKNIEITEAIKESRGSLASLINTPLMLTLVTIVYESEREIPPSLPEFFEKLFHIVLTRHDRLKDGFNRKRCSGLSDRKLQDLFEAFCFMAIQFGFGRSLNNEQFTKTFKQAIKYSEDCNCTQEEFHNDIVKGACLMLEEGVDTTTFLHKSLMEYYAAAFIKHSTDEVANLFYQEAGNQHKQWTEVINFLSSIDPYRFSKNFAIPKIQETRNQYITPLASKDIKELIKIMSLENKNLCVYFPEPNNVYGIGVFALTKQSYYTTELNNLILDYAFSNLPNEASIQDIEKILGHKTDTINEYENIEIPFYLAIKYTGEKPFWMAIKKYERWLDQKEKSAKAIIEKNDLRKSLFMKK